MRAPVSEADRQLHEQIGKEVKEKLEKKGKESSEVENFEAFYRVLQTEARTLAQTYQPQLRKGIKITSVSPSGLMWIW